jgi:hypothetical protein
MTNAPPALDENGNWSGPWWPGEAAADFLSSVAKRPSDGIRVILGGIPASSLSPPDDSGRRAFMVYVSPQAYESLKPQDAEHIYGH